jgi:hypothetical protein
VALHGQAQASIKHWCKCLSRSSTAKVMPSVRNATSTLQRYEAPACHTWSRHTWNHPHNVAVQEGLLCRVCCSALFALAAVQIGCDSEQSELERALLQATLYPNATRAGWVCNKQAPELLYVHHAMIDHRKEQARSRAARADLCPLQL